MVAHVPINLQKRRFFTIWIAALSFLVLNWTLSSWQIHRHLQRQKRLATKEAGVLGVVFIYQTSPIYKEMFLRLYRTYDGRIIVPAYDWASCLGQYFKRLPKIKSFHHYTFPEQNPGMVHYKEFANSPEHSFMLFMQRGHGAKSMYVPSRGTRYYCTASCSRII